MKDLNRLLDEPGADPLQLNLLRLARSEGPSAESRRRILAGLGVGVAAGTLSSPSAAAVQISVASGGKAAASAALKWGVLSVVAVGASVFAFLSLRPSAPSTTFPSAATLGNTSAAVRVAPALAPTAAGIDSSELSAGAPVTKLEDLPTLAVDNADASKASSAPSLTDEVAAIKGAKVALAAGNAAESLRQIDAYRARFPRGRLTQEAAVVRIEALLQSGNQAAAYAAADRFLAANPDSPYSARVRTLTGR